MDNLGALVPLLAILAFVACGFFAAFFLSRAAAHDHDRAWPETPESDSGHAASH